MIRRQSGFRVELSPAEVSEYLVAEITFIQAERQKSMRLHEVTQTHLGNAGTWFEESFFIQEFAGRESEKNAVKVMTDEWFDQDRRSGRGLGPHLWPHEMNNETTDSSLLLISQERPSNQSGQWPMRALASAWSTHSSGESVCLL